MKVQMNFRKSTFCSVIAIVAVVLMLALCTDNAAAIMKTKNLIINGCAEDGTAGWTLCGDFTRYTEKGATWGRTTKPVFGIGSYYFWGGGSDTDYSDAYQIIDVSELARVIDTGRVSVKLSGWLKGHEDDEAELLIRFYQEGKPWNKWSDQRWSGVYSDFEWKEKSIEMDVPRNTRKIGVWMVSRREYGFSNDGYFDNVTLTLTLPDPVIELVSPQPHPLNNRVNVVMNESMTFVVSADDPNYPDSDIRKDEYKWLKAVGSSDSGWTSTGNTPKQSMYKFENATEYTVSCKWYNTKYGLESPPKAIHVKAWEQPGTPVAYKETGVSYSSGYFYGKKQDGLVYLKAKVTELNRNTIKWYIWAKDSKGDKELGRHDGSAPLGLKLPPELDDREIYCIAESDVGIRSKAAEFDVRLYDGVDVELVGSPYQSVPNREVTLEGKIGNYEEYGLSANGDPRRTDYTWSVSTDLGLQFTKDAYAKTSGFMFPPGNMTVSFWLKSEGAASGNLVSYYSFDSPWYGGFECQKYLAVSLSPTGKLGVSINNWKSAMIGVNANDGEWHHIAVTRDFGAVQLVRVYMDGSRVYSSAVTERTFPSEEHTLSFGAILEEYGIWPFEKEFHEPGFNGFLDDISIWYRALSDEEILELQDTILTGSEGGLAAYWALDEGSDRSANDSGPNPNRAKNRVTISRATWPERTDLRTNENGVAKHAWKDARAAVYAVELSAQVTTVEGLELTGKKVTTVSIQSGAPYAHVGGPYRGGMKYGSFSPIQFQGNPPGLREPDTAGISVEVVDWEWTFDKTIPYNQGRRFDGTDSYEADEDTDFNVQGSLTLSAWVKPESNGMIITKGSPSTDSKGYALGIDPDGRPFFQLGTGAERYEVVGSFTVVGGDWHHIAGVYGNSQMRLYVDGILQMQELDGTWLSSIPVTGEIAANTNPLRIGARGYAGLIDDVSIWSLGMRQDQIFDLRNGKLPDAEYALLEYLGFEEDGVPSRDLVIGDPDPTQEYVKPGVYTVSLRVKSETGKWSQPKSAPVKVMAGSIAGTVRAADLRTPVDKVRVNIASSHVKDGDLSFLAPTDSYLTPDGAGGVYTYTDVNGWYIFEDLPLGDYRIAVSRSDDVQKSGNGEAEVFVHEFETHTQIVELTLDSPNQPAVDFVDLSVYPVGGKIRYLPYDLNASADDLLVQDVIVEAISIGTSNPIPSTPSEPIADATGRNYAVPLFGGKYVFRAKHGEHDIRLDESILMNAESPEAGGIITIAGPTAGVHFTDYTKRTLTVQVEDSGGYPIRILPDLEPGHNLYGKSIEAIAAHLKGTAKKKVTQTDENTTIIIYELPPGEYTVKVAEEFEGHGIGFRDPASEDEEEKLKPEIDVDLVLDDGEVTMVVPVPIELQFGPRPRLISDDGSAEFQRFMDFLNELGVDLEDLPDGYMLYWPPEPQKHTYAITAMANGHPVEDYTLVVTDQVSQMTDDLAQEQQIRIPFLFRSQLSDHQADLDSGIISDGLRELFSSNGSKNIRLSSDAKVRRTQFGEEDTGKWLVKDGDAAYLLQADGEYLYADEGTYIVLGGLPAMNNTTHLVESKEIKFQARKSGYRNSQEKPDYVTVLGEREKGTAARIISIPNVNYMVLHDPPGDGSYAYLDDSMTVKGIVSGMKIKAEGHDIPVYPSPWSVERRIKDADFDKIDDHDLGDRGLLETKTPWPSGGAFAIAAAYESATAGVIILTGWVGYIIRAVQLPILAMSIESGTVTGSTGLVQYEISPSRKVQTPSGDSLPDLVGPGKGDIYFGEGWTLGLQEKYMLGIRYDEAFATWVSETKEFTTYDILDRTNQYVYTTRDVENIIENLDAESRNPELPKPKSDGSTELNEDELEKIEGGRETWKGLLNKNLAYRWSKYYVQNAEKIQALEAKRDMVGLTSLEQEWLDELMAAEAAIKASDDDAFEAFQAAYDLPKDYADENDGDTNEAEGNPEEVETLIFSAGPAFEYSRRIYEGSLASFSTGMSVQTSTDYGSGSEIETGPTLLGGKVVIEWMIETKASIQTSQNYGASFTSGKETQQTVGFVLQDDDVGDNIATRVYTDPVWGTPLFIHDLGSVTSDPWEPGTNRAVDVEMKTIPTRLNFQFGIPLDESYATGLDGGAIPPKIQEGFIEMGVSLEEPKVETDEKGSRWFIKALNGVYALRCEEEPDKTYALNVYAETTDDGPFDYRAGAHYKIKLNYTGQRDLESNATTIDFRLYAPQTDNRDNLTVRFNGATPPPFYVVGLTKESPAANIVVSVYPPEVDQGNWYEKTYPVTILAEEIADTQINFPLELKPRFADLRAPGATIIKPYDGQRISPDMFGDTDEEAFTVQVISNDTDISDMRIESRSRRADGTWGDWTLLSDMKWQAGDPFDDLGGDPPRARFTFKWPASAIKTLGVGEYSLRALTTDKSGNRDPDLATVSFVVDASKPTVLTTLPDYQGRESERIYKGELSVTFTDDMLAASFKPETFEVMDLLETNALKKRVTGYISYSPALRKAVFVPEEPFRPNGLFHANLRTESKEEGIDGIRDLAGNPLDRDFSWTFRTTDAPFEPTWSITFSATDGADTDANNIAGVEYGALDGEDEKDARSVPPIDTQMSLSFLNEYKEKFDRDIRPADGRLSHHWFFVIGNAKKGKVTIKYKPSIKLTRSIRQYQILRLVEFKIEGSGNASVNNVIPLDPTEADIDPITGDILELEAYSYDVVQDGDTRYFRLDVQKANLVATEFQVGTSGWKFFSVPITPERADPFVNLGDDIDPFQMYQYDTATGGYKIYPLDLGEVSLKTGNGYFTRLKYDTEVDVGGSSNMSDVTLQLKDKGWHAIGNPFPKEVDVATLKVNGEKFGTASANMLVEGTLYRWKTDGANDTYEAVDQLSQLLKWEGYWIKTKQDDVTLAIPAPSGLDDAYMILPDSYKPPAMAPPVTDFRRIAVQPGEFDLRLELTSSSSADTTTILGTRQKARMDWDPMDQSEPPILGETVAAYFYHPDWGDDSGSYNRDYQPVLKVGGVRTWKATVYTDKPDSQMKLSWEESISQVPDDVMIYFRRADMETDDDWQDMRRVRSMDLESRFQFTSIPIEIRAQRYEMRPPSGVQAIPGEKLVTLRWEPDDNEFIDGYIITRQNGSAEDWRDGEGVKLTIHQATGGNVSEFVDTNVLEEVTYTYQLRVRFMSGAELGSQLFTVRTLPIIKQTALMRCYPNPFNPEVWIPYDLAEEALVSVEIYSASGQLVRTLDLGVQQRGRYASRGKAAHWDGLTQAGEKAASGVYFYVLKAGKYRASKKMVLIR